MGFGDGREDPGAEAFFLFWRIFFFGWFFVFLLGFFDFHSVKTWFLAGV
jgi:hypothetical protein